MAYNPKRGGHAPGHLRDAFIEWLEGEGEPDVDNEIVEVGGEPRPLRWLLGQLWNCTDVLPGSNCGNLDIPQGSTYAQAVRRVASWGDGDLYKGETLTEAVSLKMPRRMWKQLTQMAHRRDRSLSYVIREILDRELSEEVEPEQ